MTADRDKVIGRLAAALASTVPGGASERDAGQENPPPPLGLVRGHVTAVTPGPPGYATVRTDGVNDRVLVPYLTVPSVGDDVWLLEQPPLLLILGPSA